MAEKSLQLPMDWNQNVSEKLKAISQEKRFVIQRILQTDRGDVNCDRFHLFHHQDLITNRPSYVTVGGVPVCCLCTQAKLRNVVGGSEKFPL